MPPAIICNNTKKLIFSEFNKKLKEAPCHLRQIAAKIKIRELKKGSDRKLINYGTSKRLWDDCLDYDFNLRSNTAHNIYKLDSEVPETIMSGEMSNMSQLCEFKWFK